MSPVAHAAALRPRLLHYSRQAARIGLYGFLLFVPCSIAFSQMSLGLLAAAWLTECALRKTSPFTRTPLNWPLVTFAALVLLVTPFSVDVSRSVKDLKDLLTLAIIWLLWPYVTNLSRLRKLTGFLIGCVGVAALYGVAQHYLEVDIFRLTQPISFLKHVNDDLSAPVRVQGFFSIYMTFAGQLAMSLPVALGLLLSAKPVIKKLWLGLAFGLMSAALLWTHTRSAWIAALCALALFGIARGGKRWAALLVVVALLIPSGLLLLKPEMFDKSFSLLRRNDEERLYTWMTTLDMIRDHPLTGIGKRNYSDHIQPYRERRYPDFEFSSRAHAHNNLLQVMADNGIPAGLVFLWLWGVIFVTMYRACRRVPPAYASQRWLALGFFGAALAFFVQGFLEHNFGDTESAMMLWVYVAFGLKMRELLRETSREPAARIVR